MAEQPVPSDNRPVVIRTMLCIGLLGSAATLLLQPHPLIAGIAMGVFLFCLVVAIFRALRRTSRHIDRIMSEELDPDEEPVRPQQTWRKSA